MLVNVVLFVLSILAGFQAFRKRQRNFLEPIQDVSILISKEGIDDEKLLEFGGTAASIGGNPYFGESPHYFMPPGDVEQYRIRSEKKIVKSMLSEDGGRYVIPYPTDPPHTFPSLKVRQLFIRSPRDLKEVHVSIGGNLSSGSTKLKVPLSQLEERFRTVYSNAEKNNQLEIVMEEPRGLSSKDENLINQKKMRKIYNFHDFDGGLSTSPLVDQTAKAPFFDV